MIHTQDQPFLAGARGPAVPARRDQAGMAAYDDLQSFTPLRFMPPELMGYQGRAIVIDPDVFAVGDIFELLTPRHGGQGDHVPRPRKGPKNLASAVMLLDCAKLTPLADRRAVRRAVRVQARLHGLDLAEARAAEARSACSSPSGTTSTG